MPTCPGSGSSQPGSNRRSGGWVQALALFFGSDVMNLQVTIPPGSSSVEPGFSPTTNITLAWPTFSQAAEEAGKAPPTSAHVAQFSTLLMYSLSLLLLSFNHMSANECRRGPLDGIR